MATVARLVVSAENQLPTVLRAANPPLERVMQGPETYRPTVHAVRTARLVKARHLETVVHPAAIVESRQITVEQAARHPLERARVVPLVASPRMGNVEPRMGRPVSALRLETVARVRASVVARLLTAV